MDINFNDVLTKMQQLYPTETAHVIAEVKVEFLSKKLEELEKGGNDD